MSDNDRAVVLLSRGGLSQRAVAKEAGISRSTVVAICSGRHGGVKRPPRRSERFGRCPMCGSRGWLPCYGCAVATYTRTGELPEFVPPPHAPGAG